MHTGGRGGEHDKQALGYSTLLTIPMQYAACHFVQALAYVLQCAKKYDALLQWKMCSVPRGPKLYCSVLQCGLCIVMCSVKGAICSVPSVMINRLHCPTLQSACHCVCASTSFTSFVNGILKQPVCSVHCAVCIMQSMICPLHCDLHSVLTRAAVLGLHRLLWSSLDSRRN